MTEEEKAFRAANDADVLWRYAPPQGKFEYVPPPKLEEVLLEGVLVVCAIPGLAIAKCRELISETYDTMRTRHQEKAIHQRVSRRRRRQRRLLRRSARRSKRNGNQSNPIRSCASHDSLDDAPLVFINRWDERNQINNDPRHRAISLKEGTVASGDAALARRARGSAEVVGIVRVPDIQTGHIEKHYVYSA